MLPLLTTEHRPCRDAFSLYMVMIACAFAVDGDDRLTVMMTVLVMRMIIVMVMMIAGLLDSRRCVRLEYLCGSIVTAAQSLPLPESRSNAIVMTAICQLRRGTQ